LPDFGSAAIRNEYLEGVFLKKYFSMTQDFAREGRTALKVTSDELLDEISKELAKKNYLPLGIQKSFPPNKEWSERVLLSISPDHPYFQREEVKTVQVDNE
jgi:hypothetical protein